ncbi:MAG: 4Fe-4S binding protein [Bacteroidales bacterium]|nr:4Fe-4S binding protein [Bacteroidales bacterium]
MMNRRESKLLLWMNKSQNIRLLVQTGFLILIIWMGFQFYGFVRYFESDGLTEQFRRPPGVEGFLPISSLMGIKYFFLTGDFNPIHPAGMVLFLVFFLFALLMKKGFCGWICPVGFLSEYVWKFGEKIFKRNFVLPVWLDIPLRSLKYLILLFFVWAIITMSAEDLKNFLYGPYNRIADVKMLMFFVHISAFGLTVILVLALLSVFIKNFWCRYLCPYGAFLGFLSLFSPLKVTRNPETCTDCKECTSVCPSNIKVHTKLRIHSDECMACAACLSVCPEEDTLKFRISKKAKMSIPPWVYAVVLVAAFLIVTGFAMFTGYWDSAVQPEEYQHWIHQLDSPELDHLR